MRVSAGAATVDEAVTLARRLAMTYIGELIAPGEVSLGRRLSSTAESQLDAENALGLDRMGGIDLSTNVSVTSDTVLQAALIIAAVGAYRQVVTKGFATVSECLVNRAVISDSPANRATVSDALTNRATISSRSANGVNVGDCSVGRLTIEDQ